MKIDNIYYGKLMDTVKSIRTDDNTEPFIEVLPLDNHYKPLSVIVDSQFILSPPENITVTHLCGGELIKFNESKCNQPFRLLSQKKSYNYVATIYYDNQLKISIETKTDFFIETYAQDVDSCKIEELNINGKTLILTALYGKDTYIYIYDIVDKVTEIFNYTTSNYSFDNQLSTTTDYKDIAKHKVTTLWKYDGDRFIPDKIQVKREDFNINNLNENILPYAFLEELSVGGDITDYLTEELKGEKDKLKGFFNTFIGTMPPPAYRDITDVGVIYKVKENVYNVEYFNFELENRKISNIKRSAE